MARTPLLSFLHAAAGDGVPDAELLRRFAALRDETAFELLVRRHADLVWRVCRATAWDHHAAEDAFQTAFLVLARRAESVRGNVAGWLHRVAYRAALKARKASGRSHPGRPVEDGRSPEPDDLAPLVHEELARLPDKYRLPVLLCDLEGQTHAEAAKQLGWPVGTVSGRLFRGREHLRRRLERRGVTFAAVALAAGPASTSLIRTTASAAAGGSVTPAVAALTKGVLSAMHIAKLKLIAAISAAAVGLAGVGTIIGLSAGPQPPAPPKPTEREVAPRAAGAGRTAGLRRRALSLQNLAKVARAIHAYHDLHGHLPIDILDEKGRPLLSWRVALLPALGAEGNHLYNQFRRDEAWNSDHNKRLAASVPSVYWSEGVGPSRTAGAFKTYVQRPTGSGTLHEPGKKLTLLDATDGTVHTLLLVEAADPVEWTRPADLLYAGLPMRLTGPDTGYVNVAMGSGDVHSLRPDTEPTRDRSACWSPGRTASWFRPRHSPAPSRPTRTGHSPTA